MTVAVLESPENPGASFALTIISYVDWFSLSKSALVVKITP